MAQSWAALLATAGLAAAIAAAVSLAPRLRPRRGELGLLALVCLGVAVLHAKDDLRVFSYHGFMHASIVYRILVGGLPPGDPLFAGSPLLYAWGHHVPIAWITRLAHLTPPAVYAFVNVASLGACAALLYRIATRLSPDRRARLYAVTLSLGGIAWFSRGPLTQLVLASGMRPVPRLLPVEKFLHVNPNQLGLLCGAAALLSLLALLSRDEENPSPRGAHLGLIAATLAAAILYPLSWLPFVAGAGAACLLCGLTGATSRKGVVAALAALAAGSLLALPYLLAIQTGRSESAPLWPSFSPGRLALRGANVALAFASLALLFSLERRWLVEKLRERTTSVLALLAVATSGAALFVLLDVGDAAYKFLAFGCLALGLLGGPALADLRERRPRLAALLLLLFLLPASSHVVQLLGTQLGDPDRVQSEGSTLRPRAPGADALTTWIREQTPSDAIFVDTRLVVPVFGQRTLYVAMDPVEGRAGLAGWWMRPSTLLSISLGHDEREVRERSERTLRLLGEGSQPVEASDLAALRAVAGRAPIFAVARGPTARARLESASTFQSVYAADGREVFRLEP